jgi:tRNA (guanine37-N1)-methyltransferase
VRIDVITIFPEYLAPLSLALIGKAREAGLLDVRLHDLRAFATDRHRTVDDTPYGGGAGMVMRAEPWGAAFDSLVPVGASRADRPRVLVPSPAGRPFDQNFALDLAEQPWLVFACGRYEGIDARVVDDWSASTSVEEVSLGDYVLGGGEAAALVIVEAVARLIPGVIGNESSLSEESHTGGLLEYPVYTKPDSWRGHDVPAVLLSGHHGEIARWRRTESLRRTAAIRPDLIARLDPAACDQADLAVLAELGWTVGGSGEFLRPAASVRD